MRTDCITKTNFQGHVIVSDNLSKKPKQNVHKVINNLNDLVKGTDYDLYLSQDYRQNSVKIELKETFYNPGIYNKQNIAKETGVSSFVNITANSSKYVDAAKKAINDYKTNKNQKMIEELEKEQNTQEKEQNTQEIAEILKLFPYFAIFPFILFADMFFEGIEETEKIFKQLLNKAKKVAIKKG